jgi:hypothetical protein
MPIDLASELAKRKAETDSFTSGVYSNNPLESVNSRTSGMLSKALANENPSSSMGAATSGITDKLQKDAGRKYTAQKLSQEREKYNLISNTLVNRAVQSGMNYNQAVDYARQMVSTQIQQDFTEEQAAKSREAGVKSQDIADEYAKRGLDLESQYQPQTDYSAALTRALMGVGGTVGAYGAYKYASTPSVTTGNTGNTSVNSYQPFLNTNYQDKYYKMLTGG